jgi:hypothetical protein
MALIANAKTSPAVVTTVPTISAPIAGSFPVPPVSWANMTDIDEEMTLDTASLPISGAVFPESKYLEPTIGQIWPR